MLIKQHDANLLARVTSIIERRRPSETFGESGGKREVWGVRQALGLVGVWLVPDRPFRGRSAISGAAERVAGLEAAGLEPAAEPFHAL
jgi:hypothetical protein